MDIYLKPKRARGHLPKAQKRMWTVTSSPSMNEFQAPESVPPDKLYVYREEQMVSSWRKGEMLAKQLVENNVSLETYQWAKSCLESER